MGSIVSPAAFSVFGSAIPTTNSRLLAKLAALNATVVLLPNIDMWNSGVRSERISQMILMAR